MEKVQLKNICRPKQWKTLTGKNLVPDGKYPVYGANGIIGYYNDYNHENETLMIGCRGTCGALNISQPFSYINGNAMALDDLVDDIDIRYLYYALMGRGFQDVISGAVQPQIIRADLEKMEVWIGNKKEQKEIVDVFSKLDAVLSHRKREIQYLDDLIKARFVEMFGDLKSNSKGWPIVGFNECAEIDTNMIHDFEGYEDYPHIGIDSIEKETGRLNGYRTVAEDGVISGKYLFTEKHIIYSKIRPNLNKVAMPNFIGVCSADAYPILVKDNTCVKEYLGYIMRSKYFLDYILAFSNRTNLPKVNKKQVEGFSLPLPPLSLQQTFADFVAQIDKSKATVQKALDETQLLFDSLMQQYFG